MPFYSDAQRKWFFANISPMEKWGLGPQTAQEHDPFGEIKKAGLYALSSVVIDSLGPMFGWSEVKDKETLEKLKDTIQGDDYRAVLTKNELDEFKRLGTDEVQKQWSEALVSAMTSSDAVKNLALDNSTAVLTTRELQIAHISAPFGEARKTGPHTGIDISTYGREDVEYDEPVTGIVSAVEDSMSKETGYGHYHEKICGENGEFFQFRAGHFAARDANVLQVGKLVVAGTPSATIGSTGHSSSEHVDVKKRGIILDYLPIHEQEFQLDVALPGDAAAELNRSACAKEGALKYENGKLKLKGFMPDDGEIDALADKSPALAAAFESVATLPEAALTSEKRKLSLADVYEISKGKNASWTYDLDEYETPIKEARTIVSSIYRSESRKRCDEIVRKIADKASREFANWILSSKVEKEEKPAPAKQPSKKPSKKTGK